MVESLTTVTALYVDRLTQQWVVRDGEGQFWSLAGNGDWEQRRPFTLTMDHSLEPVPRHYLSQLQRPLFTSC
jgi:hypothetical protein